jgi:hypothetical protein
MHPPRRRRDARRIRPLERVSCLRDWRDVPC